MLTHFGECLAAYPSSSGGAFIEGFTVSTSGSKAAVKTKDVNGDTKYVPVGWYEKNKSCIISALGATAGIYIGSGNTAATKDDYTLESPITSGLTASVSTATFSYDATNNLTLCTYVITLTNTASSDIIVNEIGKVITTYAGSAIGSGVSTPRIGVLIDRTILDSPVTVEVNGSAVINYTFCFPGYVGEE